MNCPSCQLPNPSGAKFCLNCGTPLEATRAPEGERKFVTVLFADVVGSTPMGEQLDPEQVAEVMNGAFGFLNAGVTQFGGTVARLMGDAVLAIFGAPTAHEDDAQRAVLAGLAIQQAARDYAKVVNPEYGIDFRVRVGLHTGLAVLAMVGDEVKTEYTAMGDTANVAARMQSAAEPGTILITAETYHLVRSLFDFHPRGAIEVKGKAAPIETYEVVGERAVPGSMRGLEGLVSPLVGRDAQVQLLRQKIEALTEGQGACVAVVGEAGLGKSRMLAEIRMWMQGKYPQAAWIEGRALSFGQTIAYYPWRQVLRHAIGAQETDPPENVRQQLESALDSLAISDTLPFLEVMLAVESDATRQIVAELEGRDLVEHIADATRRYLSTIAAAGPAVLVIDDLHWADEASLDLLVNVCDLVENRSLLTICILRPDKEAGSWRAMDAVRAKLGTAFVQMELEPLSAGDSKELLGNLLYVEDLPEKVRSVILEKSEGNPFFLEEVIRSLIDSGHIVQENNRWRATQDIVNVAIPNTLTGVLSARIDRLPEQTKRVAQTAAVIGRIFPYPVLTATCADAPENERIENPMPHVDALTYEELVRERTHNPELEYIFKHALTQEAAYDLLLLRRRKAYHRRVGEVLERLYPQQLDDLAPLLAHHYFLGEAWPQAALYQMRAGEAAVQVYARLEAIDHYEKAYQALKHVPDAAPESIHDAILAWARIAHRFTPYEKVLERLAEAGEIARKLDDKRRLAAALNWTGNVHLLSGFPSRAFPSLAESSRLATEIGDEQLTVGPTFLTTMMMVDHDPREALTQLDDLIELAAKHHDQAIVAHSLGIQALAHARLGERAQAEEVLQRALDLVHRIDEPVKEADVFSLAALVSYDLGDVPRGLEYSRTATDKAVQAKAGECSVYARYCTGVGNIRLQSWPEAQSVLEESFKLSQDLTNPNLKTMNRAGLAMARSLSGQRDAIPEMEATIAEAQALRDDYTAAQLYRALGETYTQFGDFDRAEQSLDKALTYYRSTGMRPYLARTLESLADLRQRQGRTTEADEARAEARTLTQPLDTASLSALSSPSEVASSP